MDPRPKIKVFLSLKQKNKTKKKKLKKGTRGGDSVKQQKLHVVDYKKAKLAYMF